MVLGNSSYISCPEIWAMSLELWCPEGKKKTLWGYQCLLKITTETSRTFSFTVCLAFAIYARFQKLKSFWLFFPCFLARVCPAFCLGQEEGCWQLLGLCDLFGNVCEEHMPCTPLSSGHRKQAAPKKHYKALPFTLIFKYYWGGGSEQQGSPCPVGSGVLGLVLPGSCVLVKEQPLSLHKPKTVTITVRFLPYPQAWRPVLPPPPCQTSHIP